MQFNEAFKLALQSLWANKLRTILTLIGVVMGVASVIMVITLVNGANKYVSTKLIGYGADVFTVPRMPSVIMTAEEYFEFRSARSCASRTTRRYGTIAPNAAKWARRFAATAHVVYNGHSSKDTDMRGYTWTMLSLHNLDIALGRGFTPADDDHATHNAIVGLRHCRQPAGRWRPRSARRFAWTAFPTPSSAWATARARCWASRRTTGWLCPSPLTSRPTATTIR